MSEVKDEDFVIEGVEQIKKVRILSLPEIMNTVKAAPQSDGSIRPPEDCEAYDLIPIDEPANLFAGGTFEPCYTLPGNIIGIKFSALGEDEPKESKELDIDMTYHFSPWQYMIVE